METRLGGAKKQGWRANFGGRGAVCWFGVRIKTHGVRISAEVVRNEAGMVRIFQISVRIIGKEKQLREHL